MSWYARSGPRRQESAKFCSHTRLGTENHAGGEYRGWHYDFVVFKTGMGIPRTRYAVSISDESNNRVEYLRDFPSIQQAVAAAQQCIDQWLKSRLPQQSAGAVGTIPALPTAVTQEK